MSITIYDVAVAPTIKSLQNLDAILAKAETFAEEKKIDPEVLMQSRLRPDMLPFVAQIRIASDVAARAAARLTGSELPSFEDNEKTLADARGRVQKSISYLETYKPEQFEGAENRNIEMKLGPEDVKFTGKEFVTYFVLPNVYFHVTTAYALLRYAGLEIGKADYLCARP